MATLLHSFNSVAVDDGRQAALVESAARGDIASVVAALESLHVCARVELPCITLHRAVM